MSEQTATASARKPGLGKRQLEVLQALNDYNYCLFIYGRSLTFIRRVAGTDRFDENRSLKGKYSYTILQRLDELGFIQPYHSLYHRISAAGEHYLISLKMKERGK